MNTPEDMMKALEEFSKMVEFLNGARMQLMNQGWDKDNAEKLMIEIFKKGQPANG